MVPAQKTLDNMPDSVRGSAWTNARQHSRIAAAMCWIEEKLHMACVIVAYFSWWAVAYWLFLWLLPIYQLEKGVPALRNFVVVTYAMALCLLLFTHWLGLQTKIPRAERGWPALSDANSTHEFRQLAISVLAFSALLFAAAFARSHGSVTGKEHLPAAVESLVIGVLALWLYWKPLKYGQDVPTAAEVDANAAARESVFQRTAQRRTDSGAAMPDDYATPIQPVRPRRTFADMFGMAQVKEKLIEPARLVLAARAPNAEDPRNGILLHGDPGNGKTDFAEALAGELDVPFLEMTYGDVASKWVGEMPRVISNCFALAKRTAPCVFFIDELDSFLPSRETGSNNSEDQKITNTMLTEMVNLRRHQVVLVGATNFLSKLDAAAIRDGRFDYKVEITAPDEPARIGLLRDAAKKYGGALEFPDTDLVAIAKRWNGFSVARIRAVAKAIPDFAKTTDVKVIGYNDWVGALRTVQARTAKTPTNAKSLSELILDTSTREALVLIASRLNDAYRIEGMGGTLPNGVLFFGPSGTGKTEAARALAKASGWSFLSVAGPDLVADRSKLSAIYADARDSRPAIVFIDEADDILRSRQYSSTPDLTNKLLTLMDGVDEKVKDVIIIAATNHPDDVDPALLRAGRFTEKVGFQPPQEDQVPRFIAAWLKDKRAGLEAGLDAFDMGSMCSGQTIANIQGALQYALNRAIHRHIGEGTVVITREDFRSALAVVMGETET
jgi:transitional endoplasmic reticulum ATPase